MRFVFMSWLLERITFWIRKKNESVFLPVAAVLIPIQEIFAWYGSRVNIETNTIHVIFCCLLFEYLDSYYIFYTVYSLASLLIVDFHLSVHILICRLRVYTISLRSSLSYLLSILYFFLFSSISYPSTVSFTAF